MYNLGFNLNMKSCQSIEDGTDKFFVPPQAAHAAKGSYDFTLCSKHMIVDLGQDGSCFM